MNKGHAIKALELCRLSDSDTIDGLFLNKLTDTEGFITQHKGTTYIVFRGSESIKEDSTDWKYNLFVKKENGYHAGFRAKALSVLNYVLDDLRELDDISHIIVTGHSQGGAVATVIGQFLTDIGFEVNVITFAAPKAIGLFKRVHKVPCIRFVNGGDIIPYFPFFLCRHIGKRIKIGGFFNPLRIIKDHYKNQYAESLDKWAWKGLK